MVSLNYGTSIAHHDSVLAPDWEVLYKRYHTGEFVEAMILGLSTEGDDFVHMKYTKLFVGRVGGWYVWLLGVDVCLYPHVSTGLPRGL